MTKKARCLVEKWIDVACYTCKHYYEKMSPRSPYYPYMGVPSCRLGSEQRDLCHYTDFGYFVIDRAIHYPEEDLNLLVYEHWYDEGFISAHQFYEELKSIYPDSKDYYVLYLKEVFLDEE